MAGIETLATDSSLAIIALLSASLLILYGLRPAQRSPRRFRSWTPGPPRVISRAPDQLLTVMAASFSKRNVVTKAELRVLRAAEQTIGELSLPWKVMAQVCLGEILYSPDKSAYASINSKRVDLLLVTDHCEPIAAIEYQGSGHFLGDAAARDAVKKEALRKAAIGYIEVTTEHAPRHLRAEIVRLAELRNECRRAALPSVVSA